ncbi:MAG: ubiquinone biosynthesis protein COQ4 [Myxococcota bacterium]|jgi:ubiquinone biosynthesis protein COQ4
MKRPTLTHRLCIFLRHSSRILFNRWPGYTFADLAAIQDSMDGWAFEQVAERMRADPEGARLLQERPEIDVPTVEALAVLPEGTLGHAFWHHLASNDILEIPDLGEPVVRWDDQTEYAKTRYRQTHDLRHILLGVGIAGYEEIVLQTFQFAQQPQVLSGGIVLLGGLKHAIIDRKWRRLLTMMPRAWRAGRRAVFLSNVRFESMWHWPLDDVRRVLGLEAVGEAYAALPVRRAA